MLCNIVYSNSNLKPSKLQEHFIKRHGGADVSGHDFESMKSKRIRYDSRGTLPKLGFVSAGKPLLLASYHVAYNVAKSKKPHTIPEELIRPSASQMAEYVLGKEASKKLELVPLSNSIIQSRIQDLSLNVLDQVIAEIKASSLKISLQFDESTDVENCSQLIVLVRYVHDGSIKEDFLFCEDLKRTTKSKDII